MVKYVQVRGWNNRIRPAGDISNLERSNDSEIVTDSQHSIARSEKENKKEGLNLEYSVSRRCAWFVGILIKILAAWRGACAELAKKKRSGGARAQPSGSQLY